MSLCPRRCPCLAFDANCPVRGFRWVALLPRRFSLTARFAARLHPAFGFAEATLAGLPGRIAVDEMGNNRFPVRASAAPGGLTAAEVETMLTQAVQQAYRTRAAIRQPRGSFAQVNITVVDENGRVLGYFSTPDAPFFRVRCVGTKSPCRGVLQ